MVEISEMDGNTHPKDVPVKDTAEKEGKREGDGVDSALDLDPVEIAASIAPLDFDLNGVIPATKEEEELVRKIREREAADRKAEEMKRRGRSRQERGQSDAGSSDEDGDDDSLSSFGSDDERVAAERESRRTAKRASRAARRRYRAKVAWAREAAAAADPAVAVQLAEAEARRVEAARAAASLPWWRTALSFLVADAPTDSDWDELSEYGSAADSASSTASSSGGGSGGGAILNLSDFSDIELGGPTSLLARSPAQLNDLGGDDDEWLPAWLTDALVDQVTNVLEATADTLAAAGLDDDALASIATTTGDAGGIAMRPGMGRPRFMPRSTPRHGQSGGGEERASRPAGFR
jgi:hypothetical protein